MDASSFPLLTTLVVLPAVGAFVVSLLPKRRPEYVRLVGLIFAVATGALSVYALVAYKAGEGFAFTSHHVWIKEWGISWHARRRRHLAVPRRAHRRAVPARHRSAPTAHHDEKPYIAWLLLLEAGCMGAFLALDLFLFFVFFEIVLVPMYFLIGGWGYDDRVYAAIKFFLYTMVGSAFMLVGILATVFLHQPSTAATLTFDLVEHRRRPGRLAAIDRAAGCSSPSPSRSP